MKTEDLKPDFLLPAEDDPTAGDKAKRVPLTPEQQEARRKKLLKQQQANSRRIDAIAPEKMEKILERLGYWITGDIHKKGMSLTEGPFSFDWLGSDAIRVITTYALDVLYEGTWEWPPNRDIYPQLKKIAKSKMRHMIRDWVQDQGQIKMDDMTPGQEAEVEVAAGQTDFEELEDQMDWEMCLRDLVFKKARYKLRKKKEFLAFIDALEEYHTYEYMKDALGMETEEDVMRLEKEVLKYLATH